MNVSCAFCINVLVADSEFLQCIQSFLDDKEEILLLDKLRRATDHNMEAILKE